jgi:DNA polymerase III sliding clamp (beta) subunit (PCNA family)
MHLKTDILREAIKELKPIVSKPTSFPILSCVRIKTGDDMRLTVTDFDQTASRVIEFNGESKECALNFTGLTYALGDADETKFLFDDKSVTIKCGNKVSKLSVLDVKDFPESGDKTAFKTIGVNVEDMSAGMSVVNGFQHKDRDPLTNMFLRGSPKLLECIASNGANLAYWSLPSISATFEALVPAGFCDAVAYALVRKDAVFKLSQNHVRVDWDGGFYSCKLAYGTFLSTSAFINKEVTLIGKLETAPLLRELEACIALTHKDRAPCMNLQFDAHGLWTRFEETNENHFSGEFKPAYKCSVNANSMHKCLSAFDNSCEIYGDDRMIKMVGGDLTVYSTLMLSQ